MCKIYIILSLNKPNPKAESIERVLNHSQLSPRLRNLKVGAQHSA